VGPPGAGKSTLVDAMVEGLDCAEVQWLGTPLWLLRYYPGQVVELGRQATEEKPRRGSDRLTMNVIEYAWPFVRAVLPPLLLIEGARLEARSWRAALERSGYEYRVVYVDTPDEVRAGRLAGRGGQQEEKWLAARASQCRRFYETSNLHCVADGLDVLRACDLLEQCDPVARELGRTRLQAGQCRSWPREKPPAPDAAVQPELEL
jgi:hypothetical protein